jgi:hypothetical protein
MFTTADGRMIPPAWQLKAAFLKKTDSRRRVCIHGKNIFPLPIFLPFVPLPQYLEQIACLTRQ